MDTKAVVVRSQLPGIKVLLIGGSGTGKTTSLKTLIDAGLRPFCLFTEPGYDVLGEIPADKLHWKYVPPISGDLAMLERSMKQVSVMTPGQLQAGNDMTRATQNQFLPILASIMNFTCDRTGEEFGNVSTWGTGRVFVIDSLSGLTIAATKLAVGEKYALTQPEYGIIMKCIENLLAQICTTFRCHFVLISHAERELDEVNGGQRIGPSTIGRKLAPMLPRFFTDVLMAKRAGTKFLWDSADPQADLKARNFPIAADLPPSFAPAILQWQKRSGVIEADPA